MIDTKKLKGMIVAKGLSQYDIAKSLKMSQSSLNLKINNKRAFSFNEAKELMHILECSSEEFVAIFFA